VKLRVDLDHANVTPGTTVSGRVVVVEGGRAGRLVVAVLYEEIAGPFRGTTLCLEHPPLHEGPLAAGDEFAFSVDVPGDIAPSQRSLHGSATLNVRARCR
jgi:hypothetical protein